MEEIRDRDVDLDIKDEMQWLYSGVGNAEELFKAELNYRTNYNNLNYDLFPNADATIGYGKGYNSNSFITGLLNATGFNPISPSYNVPGWDKPVPAKYFKDRR